MIASCCLKLFARTLAGATCLFILPEDEAPILRPGTTIEDVLGQNDPVVETEALAEIIDGAVPGKTFAIATLGSGPYYLDVHSHFFDAYLVLRSTDGTTVLEDDDGGYGVHARILIPADARGPWTVDVCSVGGVAGSFELRLREGTPPVLSATEKMQRDAGDARACVEAHEQAYGPDDPTTAQSLNDLAMVLLEQGRYHDARAPFERALRIREEAHGPDHPDVMESLGNLSVLLSLSGDLSDARALAERHIQSSALVYGEESEEYAYSLAILGSIQQESGELDDAERLLVRSLMLRKRILPPDDLEIADAMSALAVLLIKRAELERARPLAELALLIRRTALGDDHPDTLDSCSDLAMLHRARGDFVGARVPLESVLRLSEASLGPNHPDVAGALSNLGSVLHSLGEYDAARPLLERAVALNEMCFGPAHPSTANAKNNLAGILWHQGDFDGAERLFRRALATNEASLGNDHVTTARVLDNLASVLRDRGDTEGVLPLLERALQIREKTLGPGHPSTATSLMSVANMHARLGDVEAARTILERAVRVLEGVHGSTHWHTAIALGHLAAVRWDQGFLGEAREMFERVVVTDRDVLASQHPWRAGHLSSLALLAMDQGEFVTARQRALEALRTAEEHYERVHWTLSESERIRFVRKLKRFYDTALSATWNAPDEESQVDAYEAVLRRKGSVSRTLIDGRRGAAGPRSEEHLLLSSRLREVQEELSSALYTTDVGDPGEKISRLEELHAERNELERSLLQTRGRDPEVFTELSFDQIRSSLPLDAVAIDFLFHRLWQPLADAREDSLRGQWTEPQVTAWVLSPEAPLRRVALGPAAAIQTAILDHLAEIASDHAQSRRGSPVPTAGASEPDENLANDRLRKLLWDPLGAIIGDCATVIISGDSAIGALPLETIRDESGSYLVERHAFAMLSDLQSLPSAFDPREPRTPSLLLSGDIDYGHADDVDRGRDRELVAAQRGAIGHRWADLPGTAEEVLIIEQLHRRFRGIEARTTVLTRGAASEENVIEFLGRHSHVHLATHGYFHPDGLPAAWKHLDSGAAGPELDDLLAIEERVIGYLPGLLSGLVLAGANGPRDPTRRNGLLTAEEISSLELGGCDLVVLSACETGLGRPEGGEGMISLRRAFRLAGARTVIASLWEVSDRATADLMTRFYENLWRHGMSKLEALRQAQLAMLTSNRETHGHARPWTWGAFVLDGAPE